MFAPLPTRWRAPPAHNKYVFTQITGIVHLSEGAVLVQLVARKIQDSEPREDLEDGNDHHEAVLSEVVAWVSKC